MRYPLTIPVVLATFAMTPLAAQDAMPDPAAQPAPTDPAAPPPSGDPAEPSDTAAPPPPVETATQPAPPASPSASAATTTGTDAVAQPLAPKVSLTAEQKVAYDGWPLATKVYFGDLTESRQALFLRLADQDKSKLVALPAAQQEAVWSSIDKQAGEQAAKSPKPGR